MCFFLGLVSRWIRGVFLLVSHMTLYIAPLPDMFIYIYIILQFIDRMQIIRIPVIQPNGAFDMQSLTRHRWAV